MKKQFGFTLLAALVLAIAFSPLALAAESGPPSFGLLQLVTSNPLAAAVAGSVSSALFAAVVAAALAYVVHNAKAREIAQVAVDVAALVDPLVRQVEATGLPGPMKFSRVYRGALLELEQKGIKGKASTVAEKYLPDIINAAAARLFPHAP